MLQDRLAVASDRRVLHGAGQGTKPLSGAIVLVIGFAVLITLGAVLLLLPISSASGESAPFSVALFTAASAVCVTGLTVVDTGSYWSGFGQVTLMFLVEIGGVGFGSAATFLFWLLGRNISLSDRIMLRDVLPGSPVRQVSRAAAVIFGVSAGIQLVGATFLFFGFLKDHAPEEAAFMALFQSISAFCNAGFDIFGRDGAVGIGMGAYRYDPLMELPIAVLVVIGGFGFPVLGEVTTRIWSRIGSGQNAARRSLKRLPLSLNARLVLVAHIGLLILGMIAIWLLERNNITTLGERSFGQQILDAFNLSVYPRSAGFAIFPLPDLRTTSLLLMLVLMFVGGASAGTGGGVKVNTIAVLLAGVGATLAGRQRPVLFKRTLTQESINKGLAIVVVSAVVLGVATFLLTLTDSQIPVERLLFEVVSSYSTVGMTMNVTPILSEPGRLIIGLIMFCGRLGPLTLVVLLSAREQAPRVTYMEEPVLIG